LCDETKNSRAREELELKPQRSLNARSESNTFEKPEANRDSCQRRLAGAEAAAWRRDYAFRIAEDRAPTAGTQDVAQDLLKESRK